MSKQTTKDARKAMGVKKSELKAAKNAALVNPRRLSENSEARGDGQRKMSCRDVAEQVGMHKQYEGGTDAPDAPTDETAAE